MQTLTTQERDLLTQALRTHSYTAADIANGIERHYGQSDGRAREAWTKAQATQQQLRELGKKLGVAV